MSIVKHTTTVKDTIVGYYNNWGEICPSVQVSELCTVKQTLFKSANFRSLKRRDRPSGKTAVRQMWRNCAQMYFKGGTIIHGGDVAELFWTASERTFRLL